MDINRLTNKLLEVNENLQEWDKYNYTPNAVREGNQLLDDFFAVHDLNDLSTDAQDELNDILDKIEKSDYKVESLEAKFDKAKGKHGLETMEEYTEFIDAKERFNDKVLASSGLSYYEYEALQQKALKRDRRRTERSIDRLITEAYTVQGKEGDSLYEYIYDKVSQPNKYTRRNRDTLTNHKPSTPRKRKNR